MKVGFFDAVDPMDLEIEPGGMRVRDLASAEQCAAAMMKIDMEIESILAQIARAEADPDRARPGWRTRAQGAIRWKKRTRHAIQTLATTLRVSRPTLADKHKAILDTIERELGSDQYERLVALAKERNPHLAWGAP